MTERDLTSACKMRAQFFVSDIPADIFWINLVAQNIGVNTLFTEPKEDMKEESFGSIVDDIGGSILGHPVLSKAIMMNYATGTRPKIYSSIIDGDLGPQKIFFFKNWAWKDDPDPIFRWIEGTKHYCYDYPIGEWNSIHNMVLSRCASTHVRDIFLHFGKMEKFGAFLANIYEVGNIPSRLLRSYAHD